MGCGASNNNVSDQPTTGNIRGHRANNNSNNGTVSTNVSNFHHGGVGGGGRGGGGGRTVMISKIIIRPKNYRHGRQLTQVS